LNKIYNYRIIILLFNDGFNPIISLSNIFSSSNWLEREAWDMFGIKFLFHPNLRRILTDYNFKGHPLRKDFPIIGYVELIYNDSIQSIQVVPVEITQSLRFFEFLNPWIKFKNYDDI
jgi:NADH:ubiquinone oxidoreductase subunit C